MASVYHGIGREASSEVQAVYGGDDPPDVGGIDVRVAFEEVDPLEDPHPHAGQFGERVSVIGSEDGRRRDARCVCGLLVIRVLAHLFERDGFERLLHRERSARGRQPPDLADLAARHRSRERRGIPEGEARGDLGGVSGLEHRGSIGGRMEGEAGR